MVHVVFAILLAVGGNVVQPPGSALVLDVTQPKDQNVAELTPGIVDSVSTKVGQLFHTTLAKQTETIACNPPQPGGIVSIIIGDVKVLKFGGSRIFYVIAPFTIALKDCAGAAYMEGGSMDMMRFDGGISKDDLKTALARAADKSFEILQTKVAAHREAVDNLLKYGLYMSSTEKQAFFSLKARENDDAQVLSVTPWGTAGRAGLTEGDTVISINGRATRGLSQEALGDLLDAAQDQGYILAIKTAAGQQKTVRIQARDLAWYRNHLPVSNKTSAIHR